MEPILIDTKYFIDDRGIFYESYKKSSMILHNICKDFVQDNHSTSKKNTIRGLHYQWDKPMDKLVRVSFGVIMDVVVDIRINSKNYGKVYYYELSEQNLKQLYIPSGFAHGFVALSDIAHVQYKCTNEYNSSGESGIDPLDKDLNINWNIDINRAIISNKDLNAISFKKYSLNAKF
jgi:dTDP-4-dehydrorhamnose 3,5-epimerase